MRLLLLFFCIFTQFSVVSLSSTFGGCNQGEGTAVEASKTVLSKTFSVLSAQKPIYLSIRVITQCFEDPTYIVLSSCMFCSACSALVYLPGNGCPSCISCRLKTLIIKSKL